MPKTAAAQTKTAHVSGWSPERRARQAARIRIWAPWAKSTGPKTTAGKARSARNAHKHGWRGREWLEIRAMLRMQRQIHQSAIDYARMQKRSNELLDQAVVHSCNQAAFVISEALHNAVMKKFNLTPVRI